jgi:hypothetical protein
MERGTLTPIRIQGRSKVRRTFITICNAVGPNSSSGSQPGA